MNSQAVGQIDLVFERFKLNKNQHQSSELINRELYSQSFFFFLKIIISLFSATFIDNRKNQPYAQSNLTVCKCSVVADCLTRGISSVID